MVTHPAWSQHQQDSHFASQHLQVSVPDISSCPQIAAFFAESLPSVGGQIVPPAGYFPEVAE